MIPSVAGIHHRELKKVHQDNDVFHTTTMTWNTINL
jgi:hypothetical protein